MKKERGMRGTAVRYVWDRGEISMGSKRFMVQDQGIGGIGAHHPCVKCTSSNGQEHGVQDKESRHACSRSKSFLDTFYAWLGQKMD